MRYNPYSNLKTESEAVSLFFQMTLVPSETLLTGQLIFLENSTPKKSFTVSSGEPKFQEAKYFSLVAKGPIPPCSLIRLPNFEVETTPTYSDNPGILGAFYHILPDPIVAANFQRRAFGIHLDANYSVHPGSAGCIVFEIDAEWKEFQEIMTSISKAGLTSLPLIVQYN